MSSGGLAPAADSASRSTSDPAAITDYALDRVRRLIGAYGEALGRTRDADELTHRLLLKLVRQQVETEAELEGVGPAT
jgi:hypothetical protein